MSYYLHEDGKTRGPFTIGQLRSMWNAGTINLETLFSTAGGSSWSPLKEIVNILEDSSQAVAADKATPPPRDLGTAKVQTIEQTSKRWKAQQMGGGFVLLLALIFSFVFRSGTMGVGLFLVGAIMLLHAAIRSWWDNG